MPNLDDYSVYVGRLNAAHGVRGELKAYCYSDTPGRMQLLDTVCIRPREGEPFLARVMWARQIPNKPLYILQLEGVTDRDAAETLVGAEITVQPGQSPPLADGTYYVDDIVGLQVVTDEGEPLGTVVEVLRTGANDVYAIDSGVLVPATAEVVVSIDIEAGKLVIKPLPGMLE